MRIAHVSPVYPPKGGMGTVAYEYVELLKERSERVEIFTPDYDRSLIKWGNAALMPSLLWRLKGFDVIHLHYPFYGGALFTAIAAFIWRTPLVMTYHMKTQGTGVLGVIFRAYRMLIEPCIFLAAKKIFVSSLDYARSIHLPEAKLEELPFSVDIERFHPGEERELRKQVTSDEEDCVFLFVGGMDDAHYFKGIDVLIQALTNLPKHGWKMLFVGEGNLRKGFEETVQKLGLSDHVNFLGRVRSEMLPKYYRMADVHILPSIDQSEAFGLVTLEAAASRTPSIVSDLPGVRTLVMERQTGFHISPSSIEELAEKMQWMMRSVPERQQMGKKARQRVVSSYAPRVIIDQLQEYYRKVTVE